MAVNVESDGSTKKFPYKILNDLSQKLKSAEDKIATLLDERNSPQYYLQMYCGACNQALLSESTADRTHGEAVANVDALKEEVCQLASTPVTTSLVTLEPSISPVSCSEAPSSGIPALPSRPLLSRSVETKLNDSVMKCKDKNFIFKMMKTLTKLETKYLTPEHKRMTRLFTRKQRSSSIVPKEFGSMYHALSVPEPEVVAAPDPFPHVRWSDVRFKPALPAPESCPVYSCYQDPGFYQEKREFHNGSIIPTVSDSEFDRLARYNGQPFGSLPGYKTNLGVVAVPTIPVGGYVYCPDAKKWVIFAEPPTSPSAGRGTRRGGGTPLTRRRKGQERRG